MESDSRGPNTRGTAYRSDAAGPGALDGFGGGHVSFGNGQRSEESGHTRQSPAAGRSGNTLQTPNTRQSPTTRQSPQASQVNQAPTSTQTPQSARSSR